MIICLNKKNYRKIEIGNEFKIVRNQRLYFTGKFGKTQILHRKTLTNGQIIL